MQIDAQRPAARRAIKRLGGGDLGALAVLAGEVGQLADLLDAAGIAVTGVLTRRGLALAIRNAYDPWGRQQRARGGDGGIADFTAGPMARDEHWSHIATDGAVHTTLWVAEWPRIDVRATFLQPLLMETRSTRSVADGDGSRRSGDRDPQGRARGDRSRHGGLAARPHRAAHEPAPAPEGGRDASA